MQRKYSLKTIQRAVKSAPCLSNYDVATYLRSHTDSTDGTYYASSAFNPLSNFRKVVKPLHVFKVLGDTRCIANLIIPIGETVFFDSSKWNCSWRKARASSAYVHSIVDTTSGQMLMESASRHDPQFVYHVGYRVYPDHFDSYEDMCAGGIHFFVDIHDALTH